MTMQKVNQTLSTPPKNTAENLAAIFAPNSQELHKAVLKHVPCEYSEISVFSKRAITELKCIDTQVKHDRQCHVIHILTGLIAGGLVETRSYELREQPYNRLIGSCIEYRLTAAGQKEAMA
ncbi:hypothetical protein [Vibrio alginolyticus]|uniref:hypothetical protein n=1 Tax=Vibrio alginolyticus TaxID=663 RepID=UPI0015F5CBFC|nr:hypothetical protein [Vibrio alginolyticus]